MIEHCKIILVENLIEVGYIRDYQLNRVDFPDGTFCSMFYMGSFIIKNLPTPFSVRDDMPPIEVAFYNGTGGESWREDKFMMNANVIPEFTPSIINNFGTEFS